MQRHVHSESQTITTHFPQLESVRFTVGQESCSDLQGIPNEEDRRVVADEVPVSVLRVELHSEAARVTSRVRRAGLSA